MTTPPSAERCFLLRCIAGPLQDESFALAPGQQLRFGRYPPEVDVLLTDFRIGRRHCFVKNDGGACVLEHVQRLKPARPRAELVRKGDSQLLASEGRHRLEIGDVICIADCSFRLEETTVPPDDE